MATSNRLTDLRQSNRALSRSRFKHIPQTDKEKKLKSVSLELDIAINTRKDVLLDINRLSKIRDSKNIQLTKEIEQLNGYKKALAEQVQIMFRKVQELTSDVIGLQDSYEEIGVAVFDDITKLAREILDEATNEYYEIARKSADLSVQKGEVDKKERKLAKTEAKLQREKLLNAQKRLQIEQVAQDTAILIEDLQGRLESLKETEQKALSMLESAKTEKSEADRKLKTTEEKIKDEEAKLLERKKIIKRKEDDVLSMEFTQGRERDRLVTKEVQLKDKEQTLKRVKAELDKKLKGVI